MLFATALLAVVGVCAATGHVPNTGPTCSKECPKCDDPYPVPGLCCPISLKKPAPYEPANDDKNDKDPKKGGPHRPDCSRILCAEPKCRGRVVTPPGKCCPKCVGGEKDKDHPYRFGYPDCSTVKCAAVQCPKGSRPVHPRGECCKKCVPNKGKDDGDDDEYDDDDDDDDDDDEDDDKDKHGNRKPRPPCELVYCGDLVCPEGQRLIQLPNMCCPICIGKDPCEFGDDGSVCGTKSGLTCKNPATTCVAPSYPDAAGKCCFKYKSCRGNKKGRCPKPDAKAYRPCKECCSHDFDCPGAQRCCSTGCGYSCMKPVYGDY